MDDGEFPCRYGYLVFTEVTLCRLVLQDQDLDTVEVTGSIPVSPTTRRHETAPDSTERHSNRPDDVNGVNEASTPGLVRCLKCGDWKEHFRDPVVQWSSIRTVECVAAGSTRWPAKVRQVAAMLCWQRSPVSSPSPGRSSVRLRTR